MALSPTKNNNGKTLNKKARWGYYLSMGLLALVTIPLGLTLGLPIAAAVLGVGSFVFTLSYALFSWFNKTTPKNRIVQEQQQIPAIQKKEVNNHEKHKKVKRAKVGLDQPIEITERQKTVKPKERAVKSKRANHLGLEAPRTPAEPVSLPVGNNATAHLEPVQAPVGNNATAHLEPLQAPVGNNVAALLEPMRPTATATALANTPNTISEPVRSSAPQAPNELEQGVLTTQSGQNFPLIKSSTEVSLVSRLKTSILTGVKVYQLYNQYNKELPNQYYKIGSSIRALGNEAFKLSPIGLRGDVGKLVYSVGKLVYSVGKTNVLNPMQLRYAPIINNLAITSPTLNKCNAFWVQFAVPFMVISGKGIKAVFPFVSPLKVPLSIGFDIGNLFYDSITSISRLAYSGLKQGISVDPRAQHRENFVNKIGTTVAVASTSLQSLIHFVNYGSMGKYRMQPNYAAFSLGPKLKAKLHNAVAIIASVDDLSHQIKHVLTLKTMLDFSGACGTLAKAFPHSNWGTVSWVFGYKWMIGSLAAATTASVAHDLSHLGGSQATQFVRKNWRHPILAIQTLGQEALQLITNEEPWAAHTLDTRLAIYDLCYDELIGSPGSDSDFLEMAQNLCFNLGIQALKKGFDFSEGTISLLTGIAVGPAQLFGLNTNSYNWYPPVFQDVFLPTLGNLIPSLKFTVDINQDPQMMIASHFINKFFFDQFIVPLAMSPFRGISDAALRRHLEEKIYSVQFKKDLRELFENILKKVLINPQEQFENMDYGLNPKDWPLPRSKELNDLLTANSTVKKLGWIADLLDVGIAVLKDYSKSMVKKVLVNKLNAVGKEYGVSTNKIPAGLVTTLMSPVANLFYDNEFQGFKTMRNRIKEASSLKNLPSDQEFDHFIDQLSEENGYIPLSLDAPVDQESIAQLRQELVQKRALLEQQVQETKQRILNLYKETAPLLNNLEVDDEVMILKNQDKLRNEIVPQIQELKAKFSKNVDIMQFVNTFTGLGIERAIKISNKRLNSLCLVALFQTESASLYPVTFNKLNTQQSIPNNIEDYKQLFKKLQAHRHHLSHDEFLKNNLSNFTAVQEDLKNLEMQVNQLIGAHAEDASHQMINESLQHFMSMTVQTLEKSKNQCAAFASLLTPLKDLLNHETDDLNMDELQKGLTHLEENKQPLFQDMIIKELGPDYDKKLLLEINNKFMELLDQDKRTIEEKIKGLYPSGSMINPFHLVSSLMRASDAEQEAEIRLLIGAIFSRIVNKFPNDPAKPIQALACQLVQEKIQQSVQLKAELTALLTRTKIIHHLEGLDNLIIKINKTSTLPHQWNMPGVSNILPSYDELSRIAAATMVKANATNAKDLWIKEVNEKIGIQFTVSNFNNEHLKFVLLHKVEQKIVELLAPALQAIPINKRTNVEVTVAQFIDATITGYANLWRNVLGQAGVEQLSNRLQNYGALLLNEKKQSLIHTKIHRVIAEFNPSEPAPKGGLLSRLSIFGLGVKEKTQEQKIEKLKRLERVVYNQGNDDTINLWQSQQLGINENLESLGATAHPAILAPK